MNNNDELDSFPKNHESGNNAFNQEWRNLQLINEALTMCLYICYGNFSRDKTTSKQSFFLNILDNIFEISMTIHSICDSGFRNPARRELRYLIELTSKACYINQNSHEENFEKQIDKFNSLLKSTSINFINDLSLSMLGTKLENEFKSDIKRIYGELSKYVHASPEQISENLSLYKRGIFPGKLDADEMNKFNFLMVRAYSISLVLYFHSIPNWVVGDFFEMFREADKNNWFFLKSIYIAKIDSSFDYKYERKDILIEYKKNRQNAIEF